MDLTRATSLDVEKPSWTFSKMPLNKLVHDSTKENQGLAMSHMSKKISGKGSRAKGPNGEDNRGNARQGMRPRSPHLPGTSIIVRCSSSGPQISTRRMSLLKASPSEEPSVVDFNPMTVEA